MIRIANYSIDPSVLDVLPESVAREEGVLPVGIDGGKLRVVVGNRTPAEVARALRRVASFANCEVLHTLDEPASVKLMIDELFSFGFAGVQNCQVQFKQPCSQQWFELQPTDSANIRFCEKCEQRVYFCKDEPEAREQTALGRCIAVLRIGYTDVGLASFDDQPEDE